MPPTEAAAVITRCAKRHLNRKHGIMSWPSVCQLKEAFLDEKAKAAGAEDCIWYTAEMLLARERLRSDLRVVAATRHAWNRLAPQGADSFSLSHYTAMTRVLYLALKLQAIEGDFDPEDCMESIEEDWEEDAAGKDHLTYDDFARSWFQLADLVSV